MFRLTYDEWQEKFKPIKNHLVSNDQIAFETYGDELDFVRSQESDLIWTEMDGDDGVYIVNGYHLVNRIQYYVCEVPCPDEYHEIPVELFKECDCNVEGEGNQDCQECNGTGYQTIWIDTREELEQIYG